MKRMDGKSSDFNPSKGYALSIIGWLMLTISAIVLFLFFAPLTFNIDKGSLALTALMTGPIGWLFFFAGLKDQIIAHLQNPDNQ